MRILLAVALAAACGGHQTTTTTTTEPPPPPDTRTPIEKRRDAACDQLAPKLFECADADAKATMSAAEYAKLNPKELRAKFQQDFLKQCKGSQMSSRQVRVLEVCFKEEAECGPLATCLGNLKAQPQQ